MKLHQLFESADVGPRFYELMKAAEQYENDGKQNRVKQNLYAALDLLPELTTIQKAQHEKHIDLLHKLCKKYGVKK